MAKKKTEEEIDAKNAEEIETNSATEIVSGFVEPADESDRDLFAVSVPLSAIPQLTIINERGERFSLEPGMVRGQYHLRPLPVQ